MGLTPIVGGAACEDGAGVANTRDAVSPTHDSPAAIAHPLKGDGAQGSEIAQHASRPRIALELLSQALLVLAILVVTLRLWRADLAVPFNYWGDTLEQLAVAKNIADGGWIWFIDRLGAPFGLAVVAFPQNLTTTSVVLKLLSLFSKEPGWMLNVYWLLAVVGASVNAHLSLRVMGYRRASATALSTLYALLPYAFYRNVAHLPVVYPFIPVLAAFAVQVGANVSSALTTRWGKYVVVCAIAQAFDYVYNTFFAVFVLVTAASLAFLYHRSKLQAARALVVVAVLVCATGVNLAPSFVEWSRHGKPPNTGYKFLAEAEIYGLKLRQLLSPVQPSKLKLVHALAAAEQQFPNENENATTRLGSLLSIGLLAMIASCFFVQKLTAQVRSAAALALACFLLATVGGFGALFNMLVTPDIRAYNRIVVFIAFFLIVYMADLIDRWTPAPGQYRTIGGMRISPLAATCALGVAMIVGVADQGQAARPLVDRYGSDAASFWAERALVNEVERRHPEGGAVMQLPETIFPPDPGHERMLPYDQARPYLASSRLSWSWPSFSYRREAWYGALGDPKQPAFLNRLATSGFVGIWIDRWGYNAQDLASLEASLTTQLGAPIVGGVANRYAYFELSRSAFRQ